MATVIYRFCTLPRKPQLVATQQNAHLTPKQTYTSISSDKQAASSTNLEEDLALRSRQPPPQRKVSTSANQRVFRARAGELVTMIRIDKRADCTFTSKFETQID
ncbi:unnamed protein product [Ectocarpus sp. 8 AP-2014]